MATKEYSCSFIFILVAQIIIYGLIIGLIIMNVSYDIDLNGGITALCAIIFCFGFFYYNFLIQIDAQKYLANSMSIQDFKEYANQLHYSKFNVQIRVNCYHMVKNKSSTSKSVTFTTFENFEYNFAIDVSGNLNLHMNNGNDVAFIDISCNHQIYDSETQEAKKIFIDKLLARYKDKDACIEYFETSKVDIMIKEWES